MQKAWGWGLFCQTLEAKDFLFQCLDLLLHLQISPVGTALLLLLLEDLEGNSPLSRANRQKGRDLSEHARRLIADRAKNRHATYDDCALALPAFPRLAPQKVSSSSQETTGNKRNPKKAKRASFGGTSDSHCAGSLVSICPGQYDSPAQNGKSHRKGPAVPPWPACLCPGQDAPLKTPTPPVFGVIYPSPWSNELPMESLLFVGHMRVTCEACSFQQFGISLSKIVVPMSSPNAPQKKQST